VVAKSAVDSATLIAAARKALSDVAPAQPAQRIETMSGLVEATLGRERLATALFGAMALIALLLSAVGIWGIVDYAVTRSTRDIGLRRALGAEPGRVLVEVLGNWSKLMALGLAAGTVMLWSLARGIESLLYGVSPRDLFTLSASGSALLIAGLLAAAGPARRAIRVNPSEPLRTD